MHICHLITGLGTGGTPVMLRNVLAAARSSSMRFSVIGMIGDNTVGEQIAAMGIPVHRLGMRPGRPNPFGLWRLVRRLRNDPPDVIQTWLYHADLLGSVAARWCGRPPVAWNIRHATLTPGVDSRSTIWTARLCGRISRRSPAAIVCNTYSGRDVHIAAGYDASLFRIIPNGFDLTRFRPSESSRAEVRRELGIAAESPIVGLIARYSRLKGHDVFIRAMAGVARERPDVHFLLCGRDIAWSNRELAGLIEANGGRDRWHLLGPRNDVTNVQAALDVAVCPSNSEAFSNSLGEAMACGVPCLATNVGDSAEIVGDTGRIIPVGDVAALTSSALEILELTPSLREDLGRRARRRIEARYDIRRIAKQYVDLWTGLAKAAGGPARRAA